MTVRSVHRKISLATLLLLKQWVVVVNFSFSSLYDDEDIITLLLEWLTHEVIHLFLRLQSLNWTLNPDHKQPLKSGKVVVSRSPSALSFSRFIQYHIFICKTCFRTPFTARQHWLHQHVLKSGKKKIICFLEHVGGMSCLCRYREMRGSFNVKRRRSVLLADDC